MIVKELIAALKKMPADAEVVIVSNYGDHCRTQQALDIDEVAEDVLVRSGYSDSGWAVARDSARSRDEDDDDEDATRDVVVLR